MSSIGSLAKLTSSQKSYQGLPLSRKFLQSQFTTKKNLLSCSSVSFRAALYSSEPTVHLNFLIIQARIMFNAFNKIEQAVQKTLENNTAQIPCGKASSHNEKVSLRLKWNLYVGFFSHVINFP